MARKKSGRKAAQRFRTAADDITAFASAAVSSGLTAQQITWCHDLAVIRLYREFEQLMLEALVTAVNNDTSTISTTIGLAFPKHLTDEVCEYLIVGAGYFDFKGRDGLCAVIQKFVPNTHYLVTTVKKPAYKAPIERLSALRNYAAHGSASAKAAAMKATGAQRLASAGAWLKAGNRLQQIVDPLKVLASDIELAAPY
jgi:hypothetical protein